MPLPTQSGGAAVVTGHSRGLGAAIAVALLDRGYRVLGISRGANADLARRVGDTFREVRLDLSDSAALVAWLETDELHRLFAGPGTAILVNNAGLLQPVGPLDTQDPASVSRAVAVNVGAALTLSAAFTAATTAAPERRILHVSSGAGRKGYAGWSVYCSTKAALDHHARAVAMDATPRLRLASVAPGIVDTDMQAEIRASTEAHFPDRQRFVELKREGKLHEARQRGAALVEFLLSEEFGRDVVAELGGR